MKIYNKKYKTNLTPTILALIYDKFEKNNWKAEDSEENSISTFNRYCRMLEKLTLNQQNLILELTDKFIKIRVTEYYELLKQALLKIDHVILSTLDDIYVLPFISKENTKSQYFIAYLLNDDYFKSDINLGQYEFKVISTVTSIGRNFNQKRALLILIDDFIGTGESGVLTFNELERLGINKDKVAVVCLVALNEGIKKIKEMGYKIYYCFNQNKGITETYFGTIKDEYVKTMNAIEDIIKPHPRDKFGRFGSEALVSLIRTPNNTFPIFWHERKKNNEYVHIAPFPRQI